MACPTGSWLTGSASWSTSSTHLSTIRSSTAARSPDEESCWQGPQVARGRPQQRGTAPPQMVSMPCKQVEGCVSVLGPSSAQHCRSAHTACQQQHRLACADLLCMSTRPAGQTMQELMKDGRKGVKEIHGTLHRAEKLVEDTLQIGQQVKWNIQVRSACVQLGRLASTGALQRPAAWQQQRTCSWLLCCAQACDLLPPSCTSAR